MNAHKSKKTKRKSPISLLVAARCPTVLGRSDHSELAVTIFIQKTCFEHQLCCLPAETTPEPAPRGGMIATRRCRDRPAPAGRVSLRRSGPPATRELLRGDR